MPNTSFEEIRTYIRTILGDSDSDCLIYSDDVLNNHIRSTILFEDDDKVKQNGSLNEFDRELNNKQKALVILRSALEIVSPNPDSFAYRSPVLSVVRKGNRQLISWLEQKLSSVNGGGFAMSSETDLQAMINSTERFIRDFEAAL